MPRVRSADVNQTCAPGQHAALLRLVQSGQALLIPVFVDPTTADAARFAAYTLQMCFSAPSASPLRLSLAEVDLPEVLTNPASTGEFIWRALVTRSTAMRRTSRPTRSCKHLWRYPIASR